MAWTIYRHICPNGKSYVGITSQKYLSTRWSRGEGYKTQVFYRAIQKYGWENICHEILEVVDTVEEAVEKEAEYIKKFHSYIYDNGYNVSTSAIISGNIPKSTCSEATREKLRHIQSTRKRVVTQKMIEHLKKIRAKKDYSKPFKLTKLGRINRIRSRSTLVIQYDFRNNPLAVWESIALAKSKGFLNKGHGVVYKNHVDGYSWVRGDKISDIEMFRLIQTDVPIHLVSGEVVTFNIAGV